MPKLKYMKAKDQAAANKKLNMTMVWTLHVSRASPLYQNQSNQCQFIDLIKHSTT